MVTMLEEEVAQVVRRTCRKAVKIIAKRVVDTTAFSADFAAEVAAGALSEAGVDTMVEVANESIANAAAEVIGESLVDAAAETIVGVAMESVMEAATESLAEVVTEVTLESVAEAVADTIGESIVEAVMEPLSDVMLEAVTEAASEAVLETVAEAASEAVFESVSEAVTEAMLETVAEAASEAVVEAAAEVATDSFMEAATDSVMEAATESIMEAAKESAAAGVEAPIAAVNFLGLETMNYRQIYQAMAGKSLQEDEYLEPYIASLLFLVIVIAMGFLLRKLTKSILPGSIQVYFVEFIATMEACSYFFENSFILKHYGYAGFFVAIVLEILISNRTFEGASENPIKALDEFSKKDITFDVALLKIAFQSLGGLASYRLAQLVWSLDMVPDHRARFFEDSCNTDLTTTILIGFLVETGAAMIDTWMGKQTLSANSALDELIKAVNSGVMIVAGVSLTGMYYNPAMATGHMLGCMGNELWELILVYWVGPFAGCVLAILLDKVLKIENGKLV